MQNALLNFIIELKHSTIYLTFNHVQYHCPKLTPIPLKTPHLPL